ncbi:MAG: beta-ketoacyl synthase [Cellvibrionales bacterium TMED148]|nr:beta-ketoacyl synthase [Porticoccaceae bacterium]RPG93434.1 MAG: beta-ketoacyl synthase [Cellvibrionales bacterium TMED148]
MGKALPVVVGFGGYNAAGRSSSFQSYRRMILESLTETEQEKTLVGLGCLMGLVKRSGDKYSNMEGKSLTAKEVARCYRTAILDGTMVRKIELFNPDKVVEHKKIEISSRDDDEVIFALQKKDLPNHLPDGWAIDELADGRAQIRTKNSTGFLVESYHELMSKAAGQLPTGFRPAEHYNSRFHPRGLQMAILGASDALHSTGLDWKEILDNVRPDEIGVYSSSALSQMTENGFGGLLQSRLRGNRTTAKQLPLGLNTMPADFINAYVLGSVGHTEATTGACATFLYVLQAAVRDIRSGRRRVAIVGNAEAGVTPEISEGFANMGALASDDNLCKLDGTTVPNHRTASRPFAENCGFVLSESTQYLILMDDALAIELGADVFGAIPEVFINADGIKKSVSAPGVGNYISFSKAVAAATRVVGEDSVRNHSFVHAHGSSTPANRRTESTLIDRIAKTFDLYDWPITATKSFVGHSLSAASGDQLMSALGTFRYHIIPGIKTIKEVASDVVQERAIFPLHDFNVSDRKMHIAFINSKGFGGNNATAVVVSPIRLNLMLKSRHREKYDRYIRLRERTRRKAEAYSLRADFAELDVIYRFGEPLIDENEISLTPDGVGIPGFSQDVLFDTSNPWEDM